MINNLNFRIDSLFEDVTYNIDAESWCFVFAEKIIVNVSGFWRLLRNGKIILVSLDHGHKFGLLQPLDLRNEIRNYITDQHLVEIEIKKETSDLNLILTNHFRIEIYITSIGYETYDLLLKNKRYIALGAGELSILESNN